MIYIAVVSWNRPQVLKRCIDSILPVVSDEVQLWVLSQGETGLYVPSAHNQHWFIEPENLGCAGARKALTERILNHAAIKPDDIIIYLDDDLYAANNNWLVRLITPIIEGEADVSGVEGMDILPDGATVPAADPDFPDYVSGGWCAIRVAVFQSGVMFDTRFFPNYYEDVDIAVQARAKGFRITSVGDVGLVHEAHPVNDGMVLTSRAKFTEKHGIEVKS